MFTKNLRQSVQNPTEEEKKKKKEKDNCKALCIKEQTQKEKGKRKTIGKRYALNCKCNKEEHLPIF